MRNAIVTGQTFIKSKKFSLQNHLKDSLGVFSAKGKYSIRVRFDKFAAQLVRERIWHPSQSIQELTGGEIELRLTLSSLHEIEPWILSWGAHAQVLGPVELIGRLKETARKQLTQYRS
jgi:proteasome accessory factor B